MFESAFLNNLHGWMQRNPFPLTPALSPRERENRSQLHPKTCVWIDEARFQIIQTPRNLLPLPRGEGWGEGKARELISTPDLF